MSTKHLTTGHGSGHRAVAGAPRPRNACPLREAADDDAAYLARCRHHGLTRERASACLGRDVSEAEYAPPTHRP
ncbi:hypothetical protein Rhe02_38900 [Rhizocola hellebori]|uniref:Uncharacterized protein n=1 Tax=Rhizocola hellebori TaxID=1392758 RepID=A0A8J3Q7Z8_9ACTN|nr:hypothetical protein Rhe02_38900 [Rhizocola hellebori]